MNLNNKRKYYLKIDKDIDSSKIYGLLDEVESDEEDDTEQLTH